MSSVSQIAPSASPLQALIVGEREEDFFLIREILERHGKSLPILLDHARSLEEARAMMGQSSYSLALIEHDAGDAAALRSWTDSIQDRAVPCILLSEHADEKTVAEIIHNGIWDYMDKSQLNGASLVSTIRRSLNLHSLQQQRRLAEESVRKLSYAVEQSADTVMIADRNGIIEYVNPAFETLTGYRLEEVIGKSPAILKSGEHGPEVYRELWKTILEGNVYRNILLNRKKNGELYYVEESISPIRDAQGQVTHFISNGRDLTDRLRLEAQLLQAQKMDAIGRLAGGVAHDFNNLLTIITSYSELALDGVTCGTSLEAKIQEILSAARRAADLTRQLLAFSRKQPQALRVVELNQVVEGITKTLRRLIGEDIELTFSPGPDLGRVRVDPVQIEQVLMNLAANSRDAMPEGGKFTIETANAHLDAACGQRKHAMVPPGDYVLVTVTDTGAGIPADQLSHIFEPFYTTKPSGKGTGLGLATVYGIVKQNRGFIWVYSEPDMGTVFRVYLPQVAERHHAREPHAAGLVTALAGSETLLLVEDEDAVRHASAEFLARCGYTVMEAKDGLDALSVVKNYGAKIHLVVSDVVMPHMSGGHLASELKTLRPETQVLFVSGYAGKTVVDHRVVDIERNFLQKPYTLKQLSGKIREILENRRSAPASAS